MPPKRVKTAHKRNEEETSNIASIPCSQSSFLKFPNETVLEILSYFPEIAAKHVNCNSCGQRFLDDPSIASPDYLREDALLVLSQTCRGLRQRLLPLLWKRFNCYNRKVGGAWYKRVSNEMEVRSVVLSNPKNKELATYVQCVLTIFFLFYLESTILITYYSRSCHVVLTRCSTKTVLPAFAQALKSMTNLETLEVLHAHSQMTTPLKNAFEGFSYPWIKTVILPSCAHNILRCCPGVISVTCTEEDGSKLVGALAAANSTKVEVLVDVFPSVTMAKSRLQFCLVRSPFLFSCFRNCQSCSEATFFDPQGLLYTRLFGMSYFSANANNDTSWAIEKRRCHPRSETLEKPF